MKTIKTILVFMFVMGISVPTVFLSSCSDIDTEESDLYTLARTRSTGINEDISEGIIELSVPYNEEYGNFHVYIQHGAGVIGNLDEIPKIEGTSATPPDHLPQGILIDSIRVSAQIWPSGVVGANVFFSIYKPLKGDSCGWMKENRYKQQQVW